MFILLVYVKFKSKEDRYLFQGHFGKLQQYCLESEKEFLIQYELAVSDREEDKIVIIEKYKDKDSYLNVHRKSTRFLEFKKLISSIDCEISGESFNTTTTTSTATVGEEICREARREEERLPFE